MTPENPALPYSSESLLRLPLVRQMLTDPSIQLLPRKIDHNWFYQGVIPSAVGGFNPFTQTLFYGSTSITQEWLKNPGRSFRPLNGEDYGLTEVLMLVHDYLHAWAYRELQALSGKRAFGIAPITATNLEDCAFFHIVSEAVATVGLDYWFLASVDLNSVIPIGSRVRMLTAQYHLTYLPEFRRFNPTFDPHRREHFSEVARFYCSGKIQGFAPAALRDSAIVSHWMSKELLYGELQRAYCRRWLRFMGGIRDKNASPANDRRPIHCSATWQREIIETLGQRLWRKIHGQESDATHAFQWSGLPQKQTRTRELDFSFLNLNALEPDLLTPKTLRALTGESLQSFLRQALSRIDHHRLKRQGQSAYDRVLKAFRNQDPVELHRLSTQPRVSLSEPLHLFFLG